MTIPNYGPIGELPAAAINQREQPETTARKRVPESECPEGAGCADHPLGHYRGTGHSLQQVDDLAQRLTAMGDVLREAVNVVAGVGREGMAGVVVPTAAFRALADAVERAQPGAVEATRKALGT